jgi:hypothetical protein
MNDLKAFWDALNGRGLLAFALGQTSHASLAAIRAPQFFVPLVGHSANMHRELSKFHLQRPPRLVVSSASRFSTISRPSRVILDIVRQAARFTPRMSKVARVRSACVGAVNASLPTGRFAASH